jgi:spore maturation protein CgeB
LNCILKLRGRNSPLLRIISPSAAPLRQGGAGDCLVKIVFFGLTLSSSWGNGHATPYRAILRALHAMGHSVSFFEKDADYYRSRRDFTRCDYCNLVLYERWEEISSQALEDVRSADVVVTASYLPEGRRINDEILALDRPLRVFYDLDTPVTLRNLGAGEAEYVRCDQLPGFDLVLSFTGGKVLKDLEHIYGVRLARPLYGCVDPYDYARVEPRQEFACDLSCMATYASDRQHKIDQLFLEPARRNPQKQFTLAGPLYPGDWQWPPNVRRREHVAPQAHPAFYSSSRITLNVTREEMARNGWCPSGRFFEAAACGTPLLSDWWEGLDCFFDVVHDIRVVARAEHVENALNLPDAELHALAAHARERTLDDHTGQVRARQFLQYLEEARTGVTAEKSEAAR